MARLEETLHGRRHDPTGGERLAGDRRVPGTGENRVSTPTRNDSVCPQPRGAAEIEHPEGRTHPLSSRPFEIMAPETTPRRRPDPSTGGGQAPGRVVEAFRERTGRLPDGVWSAPGRVNLIGEHTDYNGGCVLPFAAPARTYVGAGLGKEETITLHSVQFPAEDVVASLEGLLAASGPGGQAVRGWAAYPLGTLWALLRDGATCPGLDLVVDSDLPAGSGLSSSAALECATGLAARDLCRFDATPRRLAELAQKGENEYVGVPCGPMDQMAAMACTEGHALLFDTRDGTLVQEPLEPASHGLEVLVIDTRVRRALRDGGYVERRRSCEEAARRLGVPTLREVSGAGLGKALGGLGDPVLERRVRHVVTENERVLAVAGLLRRGQVDGVGPLLTASHRSLRDDFEVSCPELDLAVTSAVHAGALGARLTGAGFGGNALALVPVALERAVRAAVEDAFDRAGFARPVLRLVEPSAGARRDSAAATLGG